MYLVNMNFFATIIAFISINEIVQAKTKIDVTELRCLVCEASLKELDVKIKSIDPDKTVDVGGYRLDADGDYKKKVKPQSKSEIYLSDYVDEVCNRMDDYVRATWKENGTLLILNLITDSGLNPLMSDVDIIQDDDLNKSLKFYCEGIMEEYEDDIINHYTGEDETESYVQICTNVSKLCKKEKNNSPPVNSENHSTDEL